MAFKFTLTLSLIFLLNVAASASGGNLKLLFNDDRGLKETRMLAENVALSETTFATIKSLNDKKYRELDQAAVEFELEPARKEKIIAGIKACYEARIREVLTPSQNSAYTAYLNHGISGVLATAE